MASRAIAYGKLDRQIEAGIDARFVRTAFLGFAATYAMVAWIFLGGGFGASLGDLFFGVSTTGAGAWAVALIAAPLTPLVTMSFLVVTARITATN